VQKPHNLDVQRPQVVDTHAIQFSVFHESSIMILGQWFQHLTSAGKFSRGSVHALETVLGRCNLSDSTL
jgi:hypothetical protein